MTLRARLLFALVSVASLSSPQRALADDKTAVEDAGAPKQGVAVDPALLKVDVLLAREEDRRKAALSPNALAKVVAAGKSLRARLMKAPPLKQPVRKDQAKSVEDEARDVVVQLGAVGVDIDALTFLVLMEAAKASREDLRASVAGVRAINDAKSCRRRTCVLALKAPDDVDRAAFDAKKDEIANKLDALTELGEQEALRLQMAMDRMSKMMTALSNLMKKISDTAQGITQNLK